MNGAELGSAAPQSTQMWWRRKRHPALGEAARKQAEIWLHTEQSLGRMGPDVRVVCTTWEFLHSPRMSQTHQCVTIHSQEGTE